MAIEKLIRSAKRFGARYGRRVRQKFVKIEAESRRKHKCPYCNAISVRRVARGIWQCKKCKSKFTGRAYTIPKKIVIKQELEKEEVLEASNEMKEEPADDEKPKRYKEKKKENPEEESEAEQ